MIRFVGRGALLSAAVTIVMALVVPLGAPAAAGPQVDTASTHSLRVEVLGLPAGVPAAVSVLTPGGQRQEVSGSQTITGLAGGAHWVSAAPVVVPKGRMVPSPAGQSVVVGEPDATARVRYAFVGEPVSLSLTAQGEGGGAVVAGSPAQLVVTLRNQSSTRALGGWTLLLPPGLGAPVASTPRAGWSVIPRACSPGASCAWAIRVVAASRDRVLRPRAAMRLSIALTPATAGRRLLRLSDVGGGYFSLLGVSPAFSVTPAPQPTALVDLGASMVPRPSPEVLDYTVRCGDGPLTAAITATLGAAVAWDGGEATASSRTETVTLEPGQSVAWTLSRPGRAPVQQRARCLPADFPPWTATRTGTPVSQWFVLTPTTSFVAGTPAAYYMVVADAWGTPVWWKKFSQGRPVDARVGEDGRLLWAYAGYTFSLSTTYQRMSWAGEVTQVLGAGRDLDFHDLVPASDGGFYALRYLPRACPGNECVDMRPFGGVAEATMIDGEIARFNAAGDLLWTWRMRDHVDFSEWSGLDSDAHRGQAKLMLGAQEAWDIHHLNSVEDDGDGLLVSARALSAVYRIRKSDGSVDWKLGGTPTARSLTVLGLATSPLLDSQHDARRLADGTISLFDNGSERQREPRVLRLEVDPLARTAEVVEKVTDARIPVSFCCGSARQVGGGGWVVNWGGNGLTTETDAAGLPVLSIDTGAVFSYRSAPVAPGVVSRNVIVAGMEAMHPRP